jgi:Tol biopolymer transport system component
MPFSPEGPGGAQKPFVYLNSNFAEVYPKLSPNGQWVAYASDETGRYEVYATTFPTPGGKWHVSINGGLVPVWSRDGKELFYIGADRKMMAVEVRGGAKFDQGSPKPLFDVKLDTQGSTFDVSRDGHFLIPTQVAESTTPPINVVVNWTAGLKK